VKVKDCRRDSVSITTGVPQKAANYLAAKAGSLGPMLSKKDLEGSPKQH
jgi:hypothetical protein